MIGQARGVFLFLLRYVLERDISCVNSFSVQMLPDVPESPVYWAEFDPRAEAAHRGIISQMVVDFQPLSLVQNKTEHVTQEWNMLQYNGNSECRGTT